MVGHSKWTSQMNCQRFCHSSLDLPSTVPSFGNYICGLTKKSGMVLTEVPWCILSSSEGVGKYCKIWVGKALRTSHSKSWRMQNLMQKYHRHSVQTSPFIIRVGHLMGHWKYPIITIAQKVISIRFWMLVKAKRQTWVKLRLWIFITVNVPWEQHGQIYRTTNEGFKREKKCTLKVAVSTLLIMTNVIWAFDRIWLVFVLWPTPGYTYQDLNS